MTEKVVSLSGGLVLGMVFALFLGIGATQNISSPVNFEIPSVMQMTIAQTTRDTSTPAPDTTPAVDVSTPSNEDRGRITRIATVTETTDPVIAQTTTPAEPKNWQYDSSPKIDNVLRRANLQHAYIASADRTLGNCASIDITTARESNFTVIASISENPSSVGGSYTPSFVDSKPHSHGTPVVIHNNPDITHEDAPSIVNGTDKPSPAPIPNLTFDNNHQREVVHQVEPRRGIREIHSGEASEFNNSIFQSNRHRPDFD